MDKDAFIFTQALAKAVLSPEMDHETIRDRCHFLYGLAGELGNSRPDEVERIGPVKLRRYIEAINEAVENQDGPGLLEIYDELTNGQKAYIGRKLRSWEGTAVSKLLEIAHREANRSDPNYIEGEE